MAYNSKNMKELVSQIRKGFKNLQKQHLSMMKASDEIISTSNEAHSEILRFCAEYAPHLMKHMHEIDRDMCIFVSRNRKINTIFNELKKSNDAICSYCVKKNYDPKILDNMLSCWNNILDKYQKNHKDIDAWLQDIVIKWAEYENEVMKCAE